MKNSEVTSSSSASSFYLEEVKKEATIQCIQCIQGNEAFEYCINEKCQKQLIFLCPIKKCQCRQDHGFCPKGDLDFTLEQVRKKMFNTTELKQIIEDAFTSMIDKLSQSKEKILAMIDSRVKHILLHPIQNNFLSMVSSGRNQNFRSKDSSKLWALMSQNYQKEKLNLLTKVDKNFINLKQQLKNISEKAQNTVKILIDQQELTQVCLKNPPMRQDLLFQTFLKHSSILTQGSLIQRLQNFFLRKPIETKLLFKASLYKFSLKKYYEICENQSQTMIVCKTNKDKIIGGYTPLKFNPLTNEQEYIADQSGESMIFSISQNDKFELKNRAKSVFHRPDKSGLVIGNAEFSICDKADTVRECTTHLTNQFYINPKYKNNQQSYLKLNGNQTFKFSVKEWEVWKMIFSAKKD